MAKGIFIGDELGNPRKVINVFTMHGGVLKTKCIPQSSILGVIKQLISYGILSILWKYICGASINSLHVGNIGDLYSVEYGSKTIKLNQNGTKIWEYLYSSMKVVTGDSNENIYVGCSAYAKKLSSTGTQVWSYSCDDLVKDVKCNLTNVFVADIYKGVTKLTTSGAKVWSYTPTDSAISVGIDTNGDIYVMSQDNKVTKISSSGTKVWVYSNPEALMTNTDMIKVGGSGDIYVPYHSINKVVKLSTSGVKLWEYPIVGLTDINIDTVENVYITSGTIVTKLSKDGIIIWEEDINNSTVKIAVGASKNVFVGDSLKNITKYKEV
jgi:hypothetical protein